MSEKEIRLYAARDTFTGKLVSDITNPKRKYWDKKGNAEKAIAYYNRSYANRPLKRSANKGEHGMLELVTYKLVEVTEDEAPFAYKEIMDRIETTVEILERLVSIFNFKASD